MNAAGDFEVSDSESNRLGRKREVLPILRRSSEAVGGLTAAPVAGEAVTVWNCTALPPTAGMIAGKIGMVVALIATFAVATNWQSSPVDCLVILLTL